MNYPKIKLSFSNSGRTPACKFLHISNVKNIEKYQSNSFSYMNSNPYIDNIVAALACAVSAVRDSATL